MEAVLRDFSFVLAFILLALLFSGVALLLPRLIAPRTVGLKTESVYECGVDPYGSAWVRYAALFYLYALIFVAFDVDVLYLFPVASSYLRGQRPEEFWAVAVFVALLVLAIAYAWGKGVFRWRYEDL